MHGPEQREQSRNNHRGTQMRITRDLKYVAFAAVAWTRLRATEAAAKVCPVTHSELRRALVKAAGEDPTGLNNNYWGVVVDREGVVCAVAFSGTEIDSQWLLSRQIAAAKAFTANG